MIGAADSDGTLEDVNFSINSNLVNSWKASSYNYLWEANTPGVYVLSALAVDNQGSTSAALPVTIELAPAPRFQSISHNPSGNWLLQTQGDDRWKAVWEGTDDFSQWTRITNGVFRNGHLKMNISHQLFPSNQFFRLRLEETVGPTQGHEPP